MQSGENRKYYMGLTLTGVWSRVLIYWQEYREITPTAGERVEEARRGGVVKRWQGEPHRRLIYTNLLHGEAGLQRHMLIEQVCEL